MRKNIRLKVAKEIVIQLIPTESLLDETLISASKLLHVSVESRIAAQLPIDCGHLAIKGMSRVIDLITIAREELIQVHTELLETKILVGLGAVSYGDLGGCPSVYGENKSSIVNLVVK